MSVSNEVFMSPPVGTGRTEAPNSLVQLEAAVPPQRDLLASVRVKTLGRIFY